MLTRERARKVAKYDRGKPSNKLSVSNEYDRGGSFWADAARCYCSEAETT